MVHLLHRLYGVDAPESGLAGRRLIVPSCDSICNCAEQRHIGGPIM